MMLTVNDVAKRLNVSTKTVWRLLNRGELTKYYIGKSVRIDKKDLEAYLAKNKVTEVPEVSQ